MRYIGALLGVSGRAALAELRTRATASFAAYLRLWGADTADPWTKTDPTDALFEMYNLWNNPLAIWDVLNVAHEIGHTLEQGCYSGTPASSQGTIMSDGYPHPGGLANMSLDFGSGLKSTGLRR